MKFTFPESWLNQQVECIPVLVRKFIACVSTDKVVVEELNVGGSPIWEIVTKDKDIAKLLSRLERRYRFRDL